MFLNKSRSSLIAFMLCFVLMGCTQNSQKQETMHIKPDVRIKALEKNAMAIRDKIMKNFLKIAPENIQWDECKIDVKLSQTGEVLDAKVIESSGNKQIDRIVVLAVRNSSPLPLPRDQLVANEFMNFNFTFRALK